MPRIIEPLVPLKKASSRPIRTSAPAPGARQNRRRRAITGIGKDLLERKVSASRCFAAGTGSRRTPARVPGPARESCTPPTNLAEIRRPLQFTKAPVQYPPQHLIAIPGATRRSSA